MTPKAADSRENLEDLFAFESILAKVSSRFVNLEPAEVDREIEEAQRQVCECLGLDLAARLRAGRGAEPAGAVGDGGAD